MRLTKKDKVKELLSYQKNKVLMTDNEQKELKLGQLEDIEEELGIDLITLFKALKSGVYYKYKDMGVEKISKLRPITIHKNTIVCDYHTYKYFKDYGKTWALTKEELL